MEKIEGSNQGHNYTGLVYSALDADGNRVGKPLKSSLFGKQYGIETLEQTMKKSGEEIKAGGIVADTRAIVSASLSKARTGSEFQAELREKGIDLLLRRKDLGRIYGVTFIDHNSRTVLNGSALGKEFSANALSVRFVDLSQPEDRQMDMQPVLPATPAVPHDDQRQTIQFAHDERRLASIQVNQRPTVQPDPSDCQSEPIRESRNTAIQPAAPVLSRDDYRPTIHNEKQPLPAKDHNGDDSAVGSLFSILTPELERHDNNQPLPTHRKKKKRKYGRQM